MMNENPLFQSAICDLNKIINRDDSWMKYRNFIPINTSLNQFHTVYGDLVQKYRTNLDYLTVSQSKTALGSDKK